RGFQGDLIARMAVNEKSNILDDVLHLLNTDILTFDNVHWQLDVEWDEGIETRWMKFDKWAEEYNAGISKLVKYWLDEMREGKVRGIVPFLGTFKHILNETTTDLPCEAGLRSFAIRTDGKITICPLPPEYDFTVMGDIKGSITQLLENKMMVGNKCQECEVYDLCGGRCLFAEKSKLWGEDGFDKVCNITKHYIKELEEIKEEVLKLINQGIIKYEDFNYPEYNNTTEIIP
ncbi:MAG: TIGR04084 family radical SAM/SPASM domain-containing protein, partial [Candidatus Heimdallarchaeaceae archaeon]